FVGKGPRITDVTANLLFYDFPIVEHLFLSGPLINKNQLNVTKCDMMPWENVNEHQKQGLRRHYEAGCNCTIQSENERALVDDPVQACRWDRSQLSPTEYSHLYNTSACIPVSPFVCQWKNINEPI
ncbi:hypothetical protein HPG69_005026, partial [Diceros bicornis minor]